MSYPACIHGHDDPNLPCAQCVKEEEVANLRAQLTEVRAELESVRFIGNETRRALTATQPAKGPEKPRRGCCEEPEFGHDGICKTCGHHRSAKGPATPEGPTDGEMLDWLEKATDPAIYPQGHIMVRSGRPCETINLRSYFTGWGQTLRSAIAAAMKGEGK